MQKAKWKFQREFTYFLKFQIKIPLDSFEGSPSRLWRRPGSWKQDSGDPCGQFGTGSYVSRVKTKPLRAHHETLRLKLLLKCGAYGAMRGGSVAQCDHRDAAPEQAEISRAAGEADSADCNGRHGRAEPDQLCPKGAWLSSTGKVRLSGTRTLTGSSLAGEK